MTAPNLIPEIVRWRGHNDCNAWCKPSEGLHAVIIGYRADAGTLEETMRYAAEDFAATLLDYREAPEFVPSGELPFDGSGSHHDRAECFYLCMFRWKEGR